MDKRSFELKMQGKSLEREAKRLQNEAKKERNKAKAELKKGNRATAQLYAQNAVRYEQQATQLLQSCATTQGYATDMRQAQVSAEMARAMNKATEGMAQCSQNINMNKIAANRTKMDGLKSKMGAANELMNNTENEIDLNAGTEELLAALDEENNEAARMEITEIPMGIPTTNQAMPYKV